jgi:hypothetical protein
VTRVLGVLLVLAVGVRPAAPQRATLEAAAHAARDAWMGHDVAALVGGSSAVVLQIAGAAPSSPVGRAQAEELLRRYLMGGAEVSVTVVTVREVELARGFVELERRYTVRGTSDVRRETVFLGFRRAGDRWVLSEVRSGGE